MVSEITLENTLPEVFSGSESEPPVCHSQVWLRELTFKKPQFWLIEAESGTGKSRTDYRGRILFDGTDVRSFTIARWCALRQRSLAYLPQEMHLFPELTVMENIDIKNRLTGFKSRDEIRRMLDALEVGAKTDSLAGRLSVGQQRRVAIIRALCQPFDFLLIDEPVSHLDARNNAAVAAMIEAEAKSQGAGVIATSVGNKIVLPFIKTLAL